MDERVWKDGVLMLGWDTALPPPFEVPRSAFTHLINPSLEERREASIARFGLMRRSTG